MYVCTYIKTDWQRHCQFRGILQTLPGTKTSIYLLVTTHHIYLKLNMWSNSIKGILILCPWFFNSWIIPLSLPCSLIFSPSLSHSVADSCYPSIFSNFLTFRYTGQIFLFFTKKMGGNTVFMRCPLVVVQCVSWCCQGYIRVVLLKKKDNMVPI